MDKRSKRKAVAILYQNQWHELMDKHFADWKESDIKEMNRVQLENEKLAEKLKQENPKMRKSEINELINKINYESR